MVIPRKALSFVKRQPRRSVLQSLRRPMIGWLQLMVMLSLMLPPVTVTRAIYVPEAQR